MTKPAILVAGIGNIFLGDDAFGVEVVRHLAERPLADTVRVVDFGIRGFDLAYALLDSYELVIFVDAAMRGERAGTISLVDLSALPITPTGEVTLQTHDVVPSKVLELAKAMGNIPSKILLVCCEPATLGDVDQGTMGLSEPVARAVVPAVELVEKLVSEFSGKEAARA